MKYVHRKGGGCWFVLYGCPFPKVFLFCLHKICSPIIITNLFTKFHILILNANDVVKYSAQSFFLINIWVSRLHDKDCIQLASICSKLTIQELEQGLKYVQICWMTLKGSQWRCSGVFIVNFEHIWHLALVFLLLIFKM